MSRREGIDAKLGDDLREDVGLSLAYSAGRQPRGNASSYITVGAQDRPIAQAHRRSLEVISGKGYSKLLVSEY